MKLELTISDEQYDEIIIEELKTQFLNSGDETVELACAVLLKFYNFDMTLLRAEANVDPSE